MGEHEGKPAEDEKFVPVTPKGPELDGGAPGGKHAKPEPKPEPEK